MAKGEKVRRADFALLISSYDVTVQKLTRKVRAVVRETVPDAIEEIDLTPCPEI